MNNFNQKSLKKLNRYDIAFFMSILLFLGSLSYIDKRPSVSIINTAFAVFILYGSAGKIIANKIQERRNRGFINKSFDQLFLHRGNRIVMSIMGILLVWLVYIKYDMNLIMLIAVLILIHAGLFLVLSIYYDKRYELNKTNQ